MELGYFDCSDNFKGMYDHTCVNAIGWDAAQEILYFAMSFHGVTDLKRVPKEICLQFIADVNALWQKAQKERRSAK
jgi:hypothetical protein